MINDYEATKPITTDAYVPSSGTNDESVSTINGLIAICRDGEEGFKEAADGVASSDLWSLFQNLSVQRRQFADDLQTVVQTLGDQPKESGSLAGAAHRAWIDLKSVLTGNDDTAILNECERGEDQAKNAYQEALSKDIPDLARKVVQDQYEMVLIAHDRIKALRDSANQMKSNTVRPGVL